MSTAIATAESDRNDRYLSQSEPFGVIGISGERLVCSERARTRRGTDESFNSAPTFTPEMFDKDLDAPMLAIQLSADNSAAAPRPPIVTGDENGGSAQEQAMPRLWQRFRLRWLTAYRVLMSGIISVNLGILASQVVPNVAVEAPLTAAAANIMVAVLVRQEQLINVSFTRFSSLPPTLPLAVRQVIGDVHHYGGVHVGCALSALLWYIMFIGLDTVRVLNLLSRGSVATTLYVDIIAAYVTLLAILTVCVTAIPRFRMRWHNTFETMHRFGGWAAIAVLWIHAGITSLASDASIPLYAQPALWMLGLTTVLLLLPWLRIRRVPITAHLISPREVQLTLPYVSMPHTSTMRVSTAPLVEWHAFATIPVSRTSATIIISKVGDWTSSIIAAPPSHLWIRHPPTLNFLAFAPLFNSLLLVATGAGIGPLLSLLVSPSIQRMRAQGRTVRVMWCVAEPNAPHWAFALAAIRDVDGSATIFDSKLGRPNLPFEARHLAVQEGVEAVMVVSNPKVTKGVVDECKIAGLAAYGAVFDS